MRHFLVYISLIFSILYSSAEIVEHGTVKEYLGTKAKQALPGVELMIKGAQSTTSDREGNFSLHFSVLKAGEKVSYTEIYKEGYVIFNKDALDAWRISNNGRTFTIVMCKESDFRALKKKFYGIIERSYYAEYIRQKEAAQKAYGQAIELTEKLDQLEREYKEKMSNINTYVELFSRIDQSEMDSVEARALTYMEQGRIDDAIKAYEELQLIKETNAQMSKWDAAEEMRIAANGMESEAQADLISLVSKMQKQISLYQMGGYNYGTKRIEMTDNLIRLLYRLLPVTGDQYKEMLGRLIIDRSASKKGSEYLTECKKAAYLPSVIGLRKLALSYELMPPSKENNDSILAFYNRALQIIGNPQDSVAIAISKDLKKNPEGFYQNSDGRIYPYRISDGEAVLMSSTPYYSTYLEGDVILPDYIAVDGKDYPVTAISTFAFGNNPHLTKVVLPRHCRELGPDVFKTCINLKSITVNAELDSVTSVPSVRRSIPLGISLEFPETPKSIGWIMSRGKEMLADSTLNTLPLTIAIARYYKEYGDEINALNWYTYIVYSYLNKGNITEAEKYTMQIKGIDRTIYNMMLARCKMARGNYTDAVKTVKKALTDKNPYSYNLMAYLLSHENNPKRDFNEALKTIDHAIDISDSEVDKAQFIDTKGEIYLRMNEEGKALECYKEALLVNPDIYQDTTVLSNHFNPNPQESVARESDAEIQKQRLRNLAVALMAIDFIEPRIKPVFPQEFDKIKKAILTHALNINPEDASTFKDNIIHTFGTFLVIAGQQLVKIAEDKKIPFDNEWIGLMNANDSQNIDANIINLIRAFTIFNQCYKLLPVAQLSEKDTNTVTKFNNAFKEYVKTRPISERDMFNDILDGHDTRFITGKYQITTDSLTSFAKKSVFLINSIISRSEADSIGRITGSLDEHRYDKDLEKILAEDQKIKSNPKYQIDYWLDLITLCSTIEFNNIPQAPNFYMVDYEELVSIGILAVQVLLKNKTPEQLAKYNLAYIATAVRWAIRNEMQIRYPWYRLSLSDNSFGDDINYDIAKKYEEEGIDPGKAIVRTNVYQAIVQLHYMHEDPKATIKSAFDRFEERSTNETAVDEIRKIWDCVVEARNEMPEEYLDCYDYFFAKDADYSLLEQKFSVRTIQKMLDKIKECTEKKRLPSY